MKIALTGASGSIGSILRNHFKINNDLTLISLRGKHEEIFKNVEQDTDHLIHLASLNMLLKSEDDIKAELEITKKVLEICIRSEIKSLIYFSTSQVYDSNAFKLPRGFSERSSCKPNNNYSLAKLNCENFLIKECKKNDINLIILRLSPFIDLKSKTKIALLGNLAKNMKLSIEFREGDLNSRSFLTKKNLLIAMESTLNYVNQLTKPCSITLNLADKSPVSTNKIVNIISENYSVKPIKIKVPKIFELITSKMPLLKGIYENLTSSHVVDASLIEQKFEIKLLETSQSISND